MNFVKLLSDWAVSVLYSAVILFFYFVSFLFLTLMYMGYGQIVSSNVYFLIVFVLIIGILWLLVRVSSIILNKIYKISDKKRFFMVNTLVFVTTATLLSSILLDTEGVLGVVFVLLHSPFLYVFGKKYIGTNS